MNKYKLERKKKKKMDINDFIKISNLEFPKKYHMYIM